MLCSDVQNECNVFMSEMSDLPSHVVNTLILGSLHVTCSPDLGSASRVTWTVTCHKSPEYGDSFVLSFKLPTVSMYDVHEPIVRNQIQQTKEDCYREKSRFTEDDNCGNRCQCQLPAPSFVFREEA